MDIRALCVFRTHMPVRAFLMDHSGDNWNPLAPPYWATLGTQWNITKWTKLLSCPIYTCLEAFVGLQAKNKNESWHKTDCCNVLSDFFIGSL